MKPCKSGDVTPFVTNSVDVCCQNSNTEHTKWRYNLHTFYRFDICIWNFPFLNHCAFYRINEANFGWINRIYLLNSSIERRNIIGIYTTTKMGESTHSIAVESHWCIEFKSNRLFSHWNFIIAKSVWQCIFINVTLKSINMIKFRDKKNCSI